MLVKPAQFADICDGLPNLEKMYASSQPMGLTGLDL